MALLGDFQCALHVSQRAQSIGAAHRHHGGESPAPQARRQFRQLLLRIVQRFAHHHLGVEQAEQQAVAVGQVVFRAGIDRVFQQRDAVQAQFRRHRRRLAHVVGLNGAGGDQRIGTLTQRVGGQNSSFQLVAAHGHRSDIVTFKVDFAAEVVGETGQLFERCGGANQIQTRELRQLLLQVHYFPRESNIDIR